MEFLEKQGLIKPVANQDKSKITGDIPETLPGFIKSSSKRAKRKEERQSLHNSKEIIATSVKKAFEVTSPHSNLRSIVQIPDFNLFNNEMEVFVLGIIGGANSGKSILAKTLKRKLENQGIAMNVEVLKEKNFLKDINIDDEEDRKYYINNYDFDSLEAVEMELLKKGIRRLKDRKMFNTPLYSYSKRKRLTITDKLSPTSILIVEGRLLLTDPEIREMLTFSIFIDIDPDILLSRRVLKGIGRGEELSVILDKYLKFVKPAHEMLVETSKKNANIIITDYRGADLDQGTPEPEIPLITMLPGMIKHWIDKQVFENESVIMEESDESGQHEEGTPDGIINKITSFE